MTDAGWHLIVDYHYSDRILFRAFGEIRELVDSSAASPIVQKRTQAFIGLGTAYHFTL
jgi:outer membrane scaffolding protein for murein synthesis (MipA/OmpV family)